MEDTKAGRTSRGSSRSSSVSSRNMSRSSSRGSRGGSIGATRNISRSSSRGSRGGSTGLFRNPSRSSSRGSRGGFRSASRSSSRGSRGGSRGSRGAAKANLEALVGFSKTDTLIGTGSVFGGITYSRGRTRGRGRGARGRGQLIQDSSLNAPEDGSHELGEQKRDEMPHPVDPQPQDQKEEQSLTEYEFHLKEAGKLSNKTNVKDSGDSSDSESSVNRKNVFEQFMVKEEASTVDDKPKQLAPDDLRKKLLLKKAKQTAKSFTEQQITSDLQEGKVVQNIIVGSEISEIKSNTMSMPQLDAIPKFDEKQQKIIQAKEIAAKCQKTSQTKGHSIVPKSAPDLVPKRKAGRPKGSKNKPKPVGLLPLKKKPTSSIPTTSSFGKSNIVKKKRKRKAPSELGLVGDGIPIPAINDTLPLNDGEQTDSSMDYDSSVKEAPTFTQISDKPIPMNTTETGSAEPQKRHTLEISSGMSTLSTDIELVVKRPRGRPFKKRRGSASGLVVSSRESSSGDSRVPSRDSSYSSRGRGRKKKGIARPVMDTPLDKFLMRGKRGSNVSLRHSLMARRIGKGAVGERSVKVKAIEVLANVRKRKRKQILSSLVGEDQKMATLKEQSFPTIESIVETPMGEKYLATQSNDPQAPEAIDRPKPKRGRFWTPERLAMRKKKKKSKFKLNHIKRKKALVNKPEQYIEPPIITDIADQVDVPINVDDKKTEMIMSLPAIFGKRLEIHLTRIQVSAYKKQLIKSKRKKSLSTKQKQTARKSMPQSSCSYSSGKSTPRTNTPTDEYDSDDSDLIPLETLRAGLALKDCGIQCAGPDISRDTEVTAPVMTFEDIHETPVKDSDFEPFHTPMNKEEGVDNSSSIALDGSFTKPAKEVEMVTTEADSSTEREEIAEIKRQMVLESSNVEISESQYPHRTGTSPRNVVTSEADSSTEIQVKYKKNKTPIAEVIWEDDTDVADTCGEPDQLDDEEEVECRSFEIEAIDKPLEQNHESKASVCKSSSEIAREFDKELNVITDQEANDIKSTRLLSKANAETIGIEKDKERTEAVAEFVFIPKQTLQSPSKRGLQSPSKTVNSADQGDKSPKNYTETPQEFLSLEKSPAAKVTTESTTHDFPLLNEDEIKEEDTSDMKEFICENSSEDANNEKLSGSTKLSNVAGNKERNELILNDKPVLEGDKQPGTSSDYNKTSSGSLAITAGGAECDDAETVEKSASIGEKSLSSAKNIVREVAQNNSDSGDMHKMDTSDVEPEVINGQTKTNSDATEIQKHIFKPDEITGVESIDVLEKEHGTTKHFAGAGKLDSKVTESSTFVESPKLDLTKVEENTLEGQGIARDPHMDAEISVATNESLITDVQTEDISETVITNRNEKSTENQLAQDKLFNSEIEGPERKEDISYNKSEKHVTSDENKEHLTGLAEFSEKEDSYEISSKINQQSSTEIQETILNTDHEKPQDIQGQNAESTDSKWSVMQEECVSHDRDNSNKPGSITDVQCPLFTRENLAFSETENNMTEEYEAIGTIKAVLEDVIDSVVSKDSPQVPLTTEKTSDEASVTISNDELPVSLPADIELSDDVKDNKKDPNQDHINENTDVFAETRTIQAVTKDMVDNVVGKIGETSSMQEIVGVDDLRSRETKDQNDKLENPDILNDNISRNIPSEEERMLVPEEADTETSIVETTSKKEKLSDSIPEALNITENNSTERLDKNDSASEGVSDGSAKSCEETSPESEKKQGKRASSPLKMQTRGRQNRFWYTFAKQARGPRKSKSPITVSPQSCTPLTVPITDILKSLGIDKMIKETDKKSDTPEVQKKPAETLKPIESSIREKGVLGSESIKQSSKSEALVVATSSLEPNTKTTEIIPKGMKKTSRKSMYPHGISSHKRSSPVPTDKSDSGENFNEESRSKKISQSASPQVTDSRTYKSRKRKIYGEEYVCDSWQGESSGIVVRVVPDKDWYPKAKKAHNKGKSHKRKRLARARKSVKPVSYQPVLPSDVGSNSPASEKEATTTQPEVPTRQKKQCSYHCVLCPYYTTVKATMVEHIYGHTPHIPFQCLNCGERFGTKSGTMVHHRREHKGQTPQITKHTLIKEEDFFTESVPGEKLGNHSIPQEDAYLLEAPVLDETESGSKKAAMYSEVSMGSIDNRTEQTETINQLPMSRDALTQAQSRERKQKPRIPVIQVADPRKSYYQCRHCTFSSNEKEEMLRHISMDHSGDQRFICPLCEAVFSRDERGMRKHFLTQHPGQPTQLILDPDFYDICQKDNDNGNEANRRSYTNLLTSMGLEGGRKVVPRRREEMREGGGNLTRFMSEAQKQVSSYMASSFVQETTEEASVGPTMAMEDSDYADDDEDRLVVDENMDNSGRKRDSTNDPATGTKDGGQEPSVGLKIVSVCSIAPEDFQQTKNPPTTDSSDQPMDLTSTKNTAANISSNSILNSSQSVISETESISSRASSPGVDTSDTGTSYKVFRCHLCSESFYRFEEFIPHLAIYHVDPKISFKCDQCPCNIFENYDLFEQHSRTDHNILNPDVTKHALVPARYKVNQEKRQEVTRKKAQKKARLESITSKLIGSSPLPTFLSQSSTKPPQRSTLFVPKPDNTVTRLVHESASPGEVKTNITAAHSPFPPAHLFQEGNQRLPAPAHTIRSSNVNPQGGSRIYHAPISAHSKDQASKHSSQPSVAMVYPTVRPWVTGITLGHTTSKPQEAITSTPSPAASPMPTTATEDMSLEPGEIRQPAQRFQALRSQLAGPLMSDSKSGSSREPPPLLRARIPQKQTDNNPRSRQVNQVPPLRRAPSDSRMGAPSNESGFSAQTRKDPNKQQARKQQITSQTNPTSPTVPHYPPPPYHPQRPRSTPPSVPVNRPSRQYVPPRQGFNMPNVRPLPKLVRGPPPPNASPFGDRQGSSRVQPYKCPHCHFQSLDQRYLEEHKKIHNEQQDLFQCPYCPDGLVMAKTKAVLHVKQQHPNCPPRLRLYKAAESKMPK